jgi:hypothetical protein
MLTSASARSSAILENARLARRLDREHFGFERENSGFAQEHERLVGSPTTMRTTVCDRSGSDVASAWMLISAWATLHTRARAPNAKDRELGGCFNGGLGDTFCHQSDANDF